MTPSTIAAASAAILAVSALILAPAASASDNRVRLGQIVCTERPTPWPKMPKTLFRMLWDLGPYIRAPVLQ